MRTKANFKALRESVGMSQQLLADLVGVSVRSVKRWENPKATAYRVAPDDAWSVLEEYRQRQDFDVETALEKVSSNDGTSLVGMRYWHNEAEYESHCPGKGRLWNIENTTNRLIASLLRLDGCSVEFYFGEEEDD